MVKNSAGVILYRLINGFPEIFLVHPGGPYWYKKEEGAWSIPKGEIIEGESLSDTASREFEEETGFKLSGEMLEMKSVKLKSGKIIFPFAVEGNLDVSLCRSNTFLLEWPPKSGKMREFEEIDRAGWFDIPTAKIKINNAQIGIINELLDILNDIK